LQDYTRNLMSAFSDAFETRRSEEHQAIRVMQVRDS
jgi:hypothetical protein